MSTVVHGFDWPDRFVVGTVGQPGSRTFFLQARTGKQLVSVAVEKEQSAVLAERIEEILDQLMAEDGNPFSVPALAPVGLLDTDPLDQPIEEQFRAGAMGLGWDPATAQIVIEAFPYVETEEEAQEIDPVSLEPEEVLVVRIPVGSARAFAKRTREVVAAGRPICPLCGLPMDAEGHVCELPEGFQ
jgi:uncharacterized repeat protein (TIGR03847 family)